MTQLKRSIFVIPSSTLEDLPPRMGHPLASDFLAAWTSQWDPRLLVALGTLPEWKKADGSSLDLNASLVLCPNVSLPKIEVSTREQLAVNQCIFVESQSRSRSVLVDALLEIATEGENENQDAQNSAGENAVVQPPHLVEDFYALGYAVLQVQILARKLRYSWNIDWIMFSEQVLSAARASLAQNAEETEQWLQASFDSLSQERDRYCSQQAYLLDVVLLASSTLGTSLDRQLEVPHSFSLIATSKLLSELKGKNPGAWTCLSQRVENKECSLLGGLEVERPHAYFSSGSIVREFGRGLKSYTEIGVAPPKVFTRFQPGFLASSPTWLSQYGYKGVLLAAWSGGVVPDKDQAKIRWQASDDGKSLDTVLGHVLDAASADSYVDLAVKLSSQLDYHHIPTLVLAHWPGIRLVALDDFLRVVARTPSLGKFHAAEDYFATTTQPYSSDSFPSNTFKVPVPKNLLEQHELHRSLIAYEKNRVPAERLWSLSHLWEQVGSKTSSNLSATHPERTEIADLLSRIDSSFDGTADSKTDTAEISQTTSEGRKTLMSSIRKTLGGNGANSGMNGTVGYLVVNPSNHSQRMFLSDVPGAVDPTSCTRILAAETKSGKSRVVIDIPPFGFVRFRSNTAGGFCFG